MSPPPLGGRTHRRSGLWNVGGSGAGRSFMTSQVVVWDLFHQHHNLHFESIEFASNLQHCFFARFFCSKGFRAFDCGISESSMNIYIYIYIHIDAFSHSCIKNFNCSVDLLKGKCKCSRCAISKFRCMRGVRACIRKDEIRVCKDLVTMLRSFDHLGPDTGYQRSSVLGQLGWSTLSTIKHSMKLHPPTAWPSINCIP